MLCVNCNHEEEDHEYSSPMYSSPDGLPTFQGCFGKGSDYEEWDKEKDYPIARCECKEFEPPDEEEVLPVDRWST